MFPPYSPVSVSSASSAVKGSCGPRGSSAGFTLIELVVVMILIALLAAIATAGLSRTRQNAAEASAIHSLRTIQSAEDAFRASCGHGRDYAATLVQLGAAETISSDLATGPVVTKTRYAITIKATAPGASPDACTSGETAAHWYAAAIPEPGSPKASHGFATADEEEIWQDATGAAPPQPFAASQTVSRVGIH